MIQDTPAPIPTSAFPSMAPPSANMTRLILSLAHCFGLGWMLAVGSLKAQSPADPPVFEVDILPILQKHCCQCHGSEKAESGLRLDSVASIVRGASAGKVIHDDQVDLSPLLQRVRSTSDDRMPPDGERLTEAQIELLQWWLEAIAANPVHPVDDVPTDARRLHWAWQPVRTPELPMVSNLEWCNNSIDRFILHRLEEAGLQPSTQADRRTLIRRLSIDLLGLPPTFEEVEQFVSDPDEHAYEHLVDRLLASPRYAERWAQHWLDIAHYADTHGFERDQKREHAWRYRDYVIRALAEDKPYDQFLVEQIAGDALQPTTSESIIATGFLSAGPWDFVGQMETPSPVIKRLARADDLDDMVTQVMAATCAMTVNCARCHDHKLDPISQREYYQLWAVFAGTKRGDRIADPAEENRIKEQRLKLDTELQRIRKELHQYEFPGIDLAELVGGGDGQGHGRRGQGIHLATGKVQQEFLETISDVAVNHPVEVDGPYVDSVIIPDGGDQQSVTISTQGTIALGIPDTSGMAWDAIRFGPVNQQGSTTIGSIQFGNSGETSQTDHTMIGLHANAAITFSLKPIAQTLEGVNAVSEPSLKTNSMDGLSFQSLIGYGGRPGEPSSTFADAWVLIDGKVVFNVEKLNANSGKIELNIPIPSEATFLTLMATDGGNGIAFDQVFFGDPRVVLATSMESPTIRGEIERLQAEAKRIESELQSLKSPSQVYAIRSEAPPAIRVLRRGNPEQPGDEVAPGYIDCVPVSSAEPIDPREPDEQRRFALAKWITSEQNPMTSRVIVNRLWHHHFGTGIVDTPSDFGLGGSRPSHPELLDWLANELIRNRWSLKSIHRIICCSQTYQQQSVALDQCSAMVDANNRWLWRQNPRRVEAETLRDSVLFCCRAANLQMYGPGFQDFDYQEEYAPIYEYKVQDDPKLWRRTIYRFRVRTTPQPFLSALDCPDPASLTPKRNVTTTAVQALAMWNNSFVLQQAKVLAQQIEHEVGIDAGKQVDRAFHWILARVPSQDERSMAVSLVHREGLESLGRVLLNSNEFAYID